jgi:hypothetical protein
MKLKVKDLPIKNNDNGLRFQEFFRIHSLALTNASIHGEITSDFLF